MFQTKDAEKNETTHFMLNSFYPEIHAVYEMMWKNTVRPD